MENTPEAAPQGTEAVPQTASTGPTKIEAPEINAEQVAKYLGTDADTLSKFQKFVEANGKFNSAFSKMKTDISNPGKPAEAPVEAPMTAPEPKNDTQPTSPQAQPVEPKIPEGALSQRDVDIKRYFKDLSEEPAYANISKEIANGDYLKEMTDLGIQIEVAPGFYNDERIRKYLNIKSQTVPAKPTETTPDASAAPTVTYTEVGEGGIKNIEEAYKILMEPGSPHRAKAEEFIKNVYNKK